ncbi:MAG: hypothetical protein KDC69_06395 [Flavobacteriaceae bacterium]|nr:hypothetical protein [Flavobacteriaceae bacterium]
MNNNALFLKELALLVSEKLSDYVAESQKGAGKVLVQRPASELAEILNLDKWVKNGGMNPETASEFLNAYLKNTQHLHHPNYIGHQVCAPHVASGIADFIHGIVNNPMAIYEMGPAAAVIEKFLINWMLDKIGWFKGTSLGDFGIIQGNGGGVLTHGGSLANLTALLAARAKADPESWDNGVDPRLVVLAPEEAHYSIARSVSIMGMGSKAIVPVPVTKNKVMIPDELPALYKQIQDQGKKVMALSASACATATGLYDPLDEIGHFCQENGIWYHVDGAHGASALLSDKYSHLLKGIQRADSVIWDAHKLLRTSALAAAVLFKDHKTLDSIFQQKGSYLFYEKEVAGFDTMAYTVECTKTGIGTKLFWVLAVAGEKGMATYIDSVYENTMQFYETIQKHPDFECPYIPESNILCFKYTKYHQENNAYQLAIRNRLILEGNFYITSTELNGVRYLRIVVLNDLTGISNIEALLNEICRIGEELQLTFQ